MDIEFTLSFLRQIKKCTKEQQAIALKKIKVLQENPSTPSLKVHKLNGRLKGHWSFSVNYKTRIVFARPSSKKFILLAIGDHDVYKI